MIDITEILSKQREFFNFGLTRDPKYRINALKRLYRTIIKYKEDIYEALKHDLGKSSFESYMCEVGLTLSEITYQIKHLKSFSKPKKVKTPISQFSSKCYIKNVPYGNVLIMSPWNYPFLLSLEVLVDAIASGNTVILKPSAYSKYTTEIIKKIIDVTFSIEYVFCVTGGRLENEHLLDQKFDFIFFTGSQNVGRHVLEKASKSLTPVILELGGKSPCIIDETANIRLAAKRIAFGKFLNVGQTCVAPDYILIHKSKKEEFIKYLKEEIINQYTINPLENDNYGKIINDKHFLRLKGLLNEKVIFGGKYSEEKLKIEPTIFDNVGFDDEIMQNEIFGPLLPIIEFDDFDELIKKLQGLDRPLALYLFTSSKLNEFKVVNNLNYGGGCINDCIVHLATPYMPFGGIGSSGMGNYHGKYGFEAFSHKKSIMNKRTFIDLNIRYQPYTNSKRKMLKKFLK